MMARLAVAVAVVAGVAVLSCGSNNMMMNNVVDHWLGPTPHLRLEGTLKGEKVSIDMTGAAAADTTQLWCRREYFADAVDGGLDLTTSVPSEVKILYNQGTHTSWDI